MSANPNHIGPPPPIKSLDCRDSVSTPFTTPNLDDSVEPSPAVHDGIYTTRIVGELKFPRKVTQGDPQPDKFRHIADARTWDWQWRIAEETRVYSATHHILYHTLTFSPELYNGTQPTEQQAEHALDQWIRKLRDRLRRVDRVAYDQRHPDSNISSKLLASSTPHDLLRLRYVAVLERGSNGTKRLHWHVLTLYPFRHTWREWEHEKTLNWPYGHHDHKELWTGNGGQKLGWYLAKYINKDKGRTRCNLHYGSTTLTILSSMPSYRRLMMVHPVLCLKLLRRLCLSPNYPTYQRATSFISSDSSSTGSPQQTPLTLSIPPNGTTTPATPFEKENLSSDVPACRHRTEAARGAIGLAAAKAFVQDLKANSTRYLPNTECTIAEALPGLASFPLRPSYWQKTRLAESTTTRLWLDRHRHPSRARAHAANRAGRSPLPIS